MRKLLFLLVLALGASSTGCDKDLLAGGQGEVEVSATDRPPPPPNTSLGPARDLEPGQWSAQIVPQLIEGTVEIQATVSLVRTTGEVVTVIASPVSRTVIIGANQPVFLDRQLVPIGRYISARVSFSRVRATLTAAPGLIGTRNVEVPIGTQPLAVDRLVNLVVGVTDVEKLEIDLNAALWVLLDQSGVVDPQLFEQAVQIRVVS